MWEIYLGITENVKEVLWNYRKGECNIFCVDSEKVKFKVEIEWNIYI